MTEADLLNALRDCYHPRLHRNIVELKLIRKATLEHDKAAPGAGIPGLPPRYIAHLSLTATPNDPDVETLLAAQIQNRLAGLPAISRTEIRFLPPLFAIF